MEYKRPGFIPFTEKQWNDYKARMMAIIPKEALSSDDLLKDPAASQFVKNYAEENFTTPKNVEELRQKGITYKFAVMNIDTGGVNPVSIPIVNEYKGHHIYRTAYFVKDGSEVKIKYIDVVPKDIIITN